MTCSRSEEAHTHIGSKQEWLSAGHKGEKRREIDLLNEVRRLLSLYHRQGGRDETSRYVFTFQRSPHLTEFGMHQWFHTLKQRAKKRE